MTDATVQRRCRSIHLIAPLALAVAGTSAQAAPFPTYDPVSMSMGGTGVALPDRNTGTLLNPAALAALPEERRWAIGTHAGARAFDPDEFFDALDDFQDEDLVDRLDFAIEDAEGSNGQDARERLEGLVGAFEDLDAGLENVADRPIQAELGANLAVNRADRNLGIGVHTGGWAALGATANYRDSLLGDIASEIRLCVENLDDDGDACTEDEEFQRINVEQDDVDILFDTDELESDVEIRGILVREVGVTLARNFHVADRNWATGLTLKSQRVETFDYVALVDDADDDDVDADDFRKTHSDFNLDVGFSTDLAPRWRVGATVRNLIPRSYETALGNDIDLDPQLRAGVSFDGGWYRLAGDADVTRNDPVGLEDGTQFIGAGGEIDLAGWFQLRGGYRVDLVNSARNTASVGVGFSPFQTVRLNVGAAGNSDEMGGAFQLGVTF